MDAPRRRRRGTPPRGDDGGSRSPAASPPLPLSRPCSPPSSPPEPAPTRSIAPAPPGAPPPTTAPHNTLLASLDTLDQRLSAALHRWDGGALGEALLLPPAIAFQPFVMPLLLAAAAWLGPPRWFAEVAAGTGLTLLLTTHVKRCVGRVRPGPHATTPRRVDLRGRERNAAMPSGDAAQAALWAVLAAAHFPASRAAAWAPAVLPPLVAAGRVFYGCHFWGDTLAGVGVGVAVAAAVHAAGGAACGGGGWGGGGGGDELGGWWWWWRWLWPAVCGGG